MAKFKLIISDPETGKSNAVELEGPKASPFIGRRISENIDGSIAGLPKHKLTIMGGCDKDGFPMRSDVHGGIKSKILLSQGVGFKAKEKGERRRKMIRGNTITEEITQINIKVIEKPQKSLDEKQKETKSKQNTGDTNEPKNEGA